jgi:hypothetical protein
VLLKLRENAPGKSSEATANALCAEGNEFGSNSKKHSRSAPY